jgi:tripartite-type tricarboxylate transporter receptor subunit TctC
MSRTIGPGTKIAAAVAAAAYLLLSGTSALAQAWPNRAVKVIVPAPAGGPGDVIGRAIAEKLSAVFGQQFIVDNRAGANYAIGTEAVAKSAPDGYTLLMTASPHTINPALYPNQTLDPIKDFAPITLVAVTPLVLVVHPSVPVKNVAELLAFVRAQPGKVNYGSAGTGSTLHLAGEMFNKLGGVSMVHVPYKGVTQAVTDLLGGHVSLMFPGGPIAFPHVKTGKLRALATTGSMRTAAAPDLPTVAEAGMPGFEISAWYGMLAPAGTPPAIVNRLHEEIVKALKSPELKERWTSLGADVVYQDTPEQFNSFLKNDLTKWAKVIKEGNIRPD